MKDINDYQAATKKFAQYTFPDYPALAIAEEAGEIMGKLAKYSRKNSVPLAIALNDVKNGNADELKADLIKEGGDLAWQLVRFFDDMGVSMSEVLGTNIDKLEARLAANTIVGAGDNR